MIEYMDLVNGTGNETRERKVATLKRTDPEFHINQMPLFIKPPNDDKDINSNFCHFSFSSEESILRRNAIAKRVTLFGIVMVILCVLDLRSMYGVMAPHKPNLNPDMMLTAENAERFTSIRLSLEKIFNGSNSDVHLSSALRDGKSPQFKALDWIANKDKRRVTTEDRGALVQRYILAVLYYATGGETHWDRQLNWLSEKDECMWNDEGGVRACDKTGRVTDISLSNNLHGSIPEEISQLRTLTTLYLSRNRLVGPIPTSLGRLKQLTYLGLQHNKLKGTIPPALGNLRQLQFLFLHKNDLTGTVAKAHPVCQLRQTKLDEEENMAMDGSSPPSLHRNTTSIEAAAPVFFSSLALKAFTADCRGILNLKSPEITCSCCTKCHRF